MLTSPFGTGTFSTFSVTCHPSRSIAASLVLPTGSAWGLRDYGADGQIGLESTPDEYVARIVDVFREVRRVLAPHGTCWVNLGDSYAAGKAGRADGERRGVDGFTGGRKFEDADVGFSHRSAPPGFKPKDLVGIPWRVAFALQADGWYLRSDIIWSKPNPMPESVTDRPTKSHEYVYLLSKNPRYYFDSEAVREPHKEDGRKVTTVVGGNGSIQHRDGERWPNSGRNIRSVWEIATQPYPEAHFATYPEELVRRCLLAGCPERVCRTCGKPSERIVDSEYTKHRPSGGKTSRVERGNKVHDDGFGSWGTFGTNLRKNVTTLGWTDCGHDDYRAGTVLDPFAGAGTTSLVARKHGRHTIGIELSADYCDLIATRLQQLSLLADVTSTSAPLPMRRSRGLTGGAYSPPGQSPHSNARHAEPSGLEDMHPTKGTRS